MFHWEKNYFIGTRNSPSRDESKTTTVLLGCLGSVLYVYEVWMSGQKENAVCWIFKGNIRSVQTLKTE